MGQSQMPLSMHIMTQIAYNPINWRGCKQLAKADWPSLEILCLGEHDIMQQAMNSDRIPGTQSAQWGCSI